MHSGNELRLKWGKEFDPIHLSFPTTGWVSLTIWQMSRPRLLFEFYDWPKELQMPLVFSLVVKEQLTKSVNKSICYAYTYKYGI